MSEELEQLNVRFGELVGAERGNGGGIRRAGFGTKEETAPLVRDGHMVCNKCSM
jgi:hypothetical protein